MANKEQCLWLGSRQGSRQSSSIQAKTHVLLSSQHPSKEEKPRRNRICREEEPKQGEQGSDLKTFLPAQHLKAWEVGMTFACSQAWPRCWGHREPQERPKWGPGCPATLPLWVVGNSLVLLQGQHRRCSDGSLRWCPGMMPWGDVPSPGNQARETTQVHLLTQAFRSEMLKGGSWSLNHIAIPPIKARIHPRKMLQLLGNLSSVPLCSSLALRMQGLVGNHNSATRKSIWTVQWFLISWLHLTLNNYFHFKGQIPIQFKTPLDFSGIWPPDKMETKETLRVTKKLQKYWKPRGDS